MPISVLVQNGRKLCYQYSITVLSVLSRAVKKNNCGSYERANFFWLRFIFPSLKCIENCILVVGWTTTKPNQIQFRPKWGELTNWVDLVRLSCVSLIAYLVKDGRAWIWKLEANQGFISVLWTSVHQSWRCHFWIKSKMWCFVSANLLIFFSSSWLFENRYNQVKFCHWIVIILVYLHNLLKIILRAWM